MRKWFVVSTFLLEVNVVPSLAQAQTPQYTLALGNMIVWDGVSREPGATDSDYATVAAMGPDGKWVSITRGKHDLGNMDQWDWWRNDNSTTPPVSVPNDRNSWLTINVMVTNAGHKDYGNIQDTLNKVIMQQFTPTDSMGQFVDRLSKGLIQRGIDLLKPNCDAVLFGEVIQIDGASLATGAGWEVAPEQPNTWYIVLDFSGPGGTLMVPDGCNPNAHYNLVVKFTRVS